MKTIKKYKYTCTNPWSIRGANREVLKAGRFLIAQIKKGWTPEEACDQTEQSYGYLISQEVFKGFVRVLIK